MDTKEAIEWIFDVWHEWENVYGFDSEQNLKEGKKLEEVIEMLKRGEKQEAILKLVEEKKIQPEINDCGEIVFILKINKKFKGVFFSLRAVFRHLLCHTMKEIKQKYFPKPSDNFTEKVMEKIDNEGER